MPSGEYIHCPHCKCSIDIDEVEAEDGCCPECGLWVGRSSFDNESEEVDEGIGDPEGWDDENIDTDDNTQPDSLDELNSEDGFSSEDDEDNFPSDDEEEASGGRRRSSRRKKK